MKPELSVVIRAQGADVERLVCKFGVWRLVWVRFRTHDGQRRGSFIFASPGSRCTFETIHQSLSLFVAISGSGKSSRLMVCTIPVGMVLR